MRTPPPPRATVWVISSCFGKFGRRHGNSPNIWLPWLQGRKWGGGEEGEPPLPTQNRGFRAPEGRGFEEGAGLPRVSASEGGEGSEDPPIDPNIWGPPLPPQNSSIFGTPPPPYLGTPS